MVERFAAALPDGKPRYLMGAGHAGGHPATPSRYGVDLFDCVLPARNARHGLLFTRGGVLRIKNAAFRDDDAAARSRTAAARPACGSPGRSSTT